MIRVQAGTPRRLERGTQRVPGPWAHGDFSYETVDTMSLRALVILGHGSRTDGPVRAFGRIVDAVRERGIYDLVEGAFMELSQPGLAEVVRSLVEKGADDVTVVPYILFEGTHYNRDIPAKLSALAETFPGVTFRLGMPVGFDPVMIEVILARAAGAVPAGGRG